MVQIKQAVQLILKSHLFGHQIRFSGPKAFYLERCALQIQTHRYIHTLKDDRAYYIRHKTLKITFAQFYFDIQSFISLSFPQVG